MFYKHWKKLALALTGLFWASCDDSASSSEVVLYGCPDDICAPAPKSSSDANDTQSSSSDPSTSSGAEISSSSSEFGVISSSSLELIAPEYGVFGGTCYGDPESQGTYRCNDGVTCQEKVSERWVPEYNCVEDICPEYGVVAITEKTYECDGKIYSEAEFRSRYSQVIIPKDSSEATGSETLCFNDSVQNTEGRVFKIIDCIDGNKYLRDPSAAGVEGVELPEGVQVFAPKAGSEQAPNCTENGDVCIERNPNLTVEEDSLAGCHQVIDCPPKP
ncbi:hypothetical protein [Fibrobacter sp.]|uniref:hypothetical protein n=1 Tax=Fibrobacter sp. TaxID=35828 RepID=UPI00389066FB